MYKIIRSLSFNLDTTCTCEFLTKKAEIRYDEYNLSFLNNSCVEINSKLNEKNRMITYEYYKNENICLEEVPEDLS